MRTWRIGAKGYAEGATAGGIAGHDRGLRPDGRARRSRPAEARAPAQLRALDQRSGGTARPRVPRTGERGRRAQVVRADDRGRPGAAPDRDRLLATGVQAGRLPDDREAARFGARLGAPLGLLPDGRDRGGFREPGAGTAAPGAVRGRPPLAQRRRVPGPAELALELGREREQAALAVRRSDQLRSDGQAVAGRRRRYRERRLARHVPDAGEGVDRG